MKKKLFTGTILPSIAALAVIGSGFSLWIFDDSNSITTSGSVGINVTKVLDITNSEIGIANSTNSCLLFDQTSTGADGINPNGGGLTWADNRNFGDAPQAAIFSLNDPTIDNAVAYDDSVNYTFTTTITLSKVLASYVELSFNKNTDSTAKSWDNGTWTSDKNASSGVVIYTYTFDSKNTLQKTYDSTFSEIMFSFGWVKASYVSGAEPITLGESDEDEGSYLKMLKDVKYQTISVTYEVKASIVSE